MSFLPNFELLEIGHVCLQDKAPKLSSLEAQQLDQHDLLLFSPCHLCLTWTREHIDLAPHAEFG